MLVLGFDDTFGGYLDESSRWNMLDFIRCTLHLKNKTESLSGDNTDCTLMINNNSVDDPRVAVDDDNDIVTIGGVSATPSRDLRATIRFKNSTEPLAVVDSIDVERLLPSGMATITDISVPAGTAYFDGSGKTDSANIVAGQNFSFYTKGCVLFDRTAYTSRGEADYSQWTENGWLNLDDGNHVLLNDPENPGNRYDVEIVANDALYNALRSGIRAEDISKDITLTAQSATARTSLLFIPDTMIGSAVMKALQQS